MEKIIRAVKQHSKPLSAETMLFLRGIAEDYAKVKNYVYRRYSGVASLAKLFPGYTVQNEMNATSLRSELNLPYGYYGLAIFDALRDIKSCWGNLQAKIVELVYKNENLTNNERHYINWVLSRDKVYAAILNRNEIERPNNFEGLNFKRLDNLICRLTRKHKFSIGEIITANYFQALKKCFKYSDGGIWFTSRIAHKRVYIPLTDSTIYNVSQITVQLAENTIELIVPVETTVKVHAEYTSIIALSLGYVAMFTSNNGNEYGAELGKLLAKRYERISEKRLARVVYHRLYRKLTTDGNAKLAENIYSNNLGIKKLLAKSERELDGIKSYINAEINRMFDVEKPAEIIIPAQSKQFSPNMKQSAQQKLSKWQVGYIRKRLDDKCAVNGVKLTKIAGAYTAMVCAVCGDRGCREAQTFICDTCGNVTSYPQNAAKNLLRKKDGTFRNPRDNV
jgi:transposase